MSLRAYIQTTTNEEIKGNKRIKIIEEEIEPLFNLNENEEVLDVFETFGTVFKSQNWDTYLIELNQDGWDYYKESISDGDYDKPTKDIEILQKIDTYLKSHEDLICICY